VGRWVVFNAIFPVQMGTWFVVSAPLSLGSSVDPGLEVRRALALRAWLCGEPPPQQGRCGIRQAIPAVGQRFRGPYGRECHGARQRGSRGDARLLSRRRGVCLARTRRTVSVPIRYQVQLAVRHKAIVRSRLALRPESPPAHLLGCRSSHPAGVSIVGK
jgi:hypothetical protein